MSKPSFKSAWTASKAIYDPANPAAKVARVIGGKVAANINQVDPALRWVNTCAVRISYILNQCGVMVPYHRGQTVSGADGRWYFFRVRNVISFLKLRWGSPDAIVQYPPSGGGSLAKQKGLILFEISGWADAGGHATLWTGTECYDHCYFNEPGSKYRTNRANYWKLPE